MDDTDPTQEQLQRRLGQLRQERDAARALFERLKARKSVRLALGVASLFEPLYRLAGREHSRPEQRTPGRLKAWTTARRIRSLRKSSPVTSGPTVSVVVPSRRPAHEVEELLRELARRTHYQELEVVLVDNGAGTLGSLATADLPFPVKVLTNERNESFSVACNQGARAAKGELVLFLNDDIRPINAEWLGAMVASIADSGVGAVGSLLVYAGERPAYATSHTSLSVQHRGIVFGWKDGIPVGRHLDAGADPTNPAFLETKEVPAVTAACMLVRRTDFDAVGGFDEGYVYGWEDLDLCFKLRELGQKIVVAGTAALWHEEFGTQSTLPHQVRRVNYRANSRRFLDRWAPLLWRHVLLDQLAGTGFWTADRTKKAAITLSHPNPDKGFGDWYTAHELGAALEDQGWQVTYAARTDGAWFELPGDIDLLISLLPQYDLSRAPAGAFKVAWVRNWLKRWLANDSFHSYDLVVAATGHFAREIELRSAVEVVVHPLATNPKHFSAGSSEVAFEADYVFAGNYWNTARDLLDRLDVEPGEEFRIYGLGWEKVPRARRWWSENLDYETLPSAYRSAKLVLDDTAKPNRPALNARVFDALASGTLVVTDNMDGSEEWFDGRLPVYRSRADLRSQLDRYLGDRELRTQLVTALRKEVVEHHTYKARAHQFVSESIDTLHKPSIAIRIGPPGQDVAEQWGDTHFARGFARALQRLGYTTRISLLPDWDAPDHQRADIVVHLRGLTPYVPKPAHLNALWIISHPEEVSPQECERFDVVFVASDSFAEQLQGKVDVPVHPLLQATDPDLFRPLEPIEELHSQLLFVGNSRGVFRPAVRWAVEAGLPLTLYGSGWEEFVDADRIAGTYFPYERLPELFASADIVLADHWPDMVTHGFVSNRIYDALACGTFVISDSKLAAAIIGPDAVPTFTTAEALEQLFRRYTEAPSERMEMTGHAEKVVRRHHTFDVRAAEFYEVLTTLDLPRAAPLSSLSPRVTSLKG